MSASVAAIPAVPVQPEPSLASHWGLADFSFHDLLSIVNPLQHLPIVSTVYRAITGDTIRPFERIAGDSLYGGLWGFVSSVANVGYQEITGKDFGDTVLAFLEGKDANNTAVADNSTPATSNVASAAQPQSTLPAQVAANGPPRTLLHAAAFVQPASDDPSARALLSSMNAKGFNPELSQRALTAYNRSLLASPPAVSGPAL